MITIGKEDILRFLLKHLRLFLILGIIWGTHHFWGLFPALMVALFFILSDISDIIAQNEEEKIEREELKERIEDIWNVISLHRNRF